MDISNVLTLAGQFGPMGFMVGYLVWRERQEREFRRHEAAADRQLARETNEANLEQARALTLLTAIIQGMNR